MSYNSGVWSDGNFTTVENQTMFIVPQNDDTITLDYNLRLMITDNYLYPKVYEVTKATDTVPLGCLKIILKQVHHNKNTDLCGIDYSHKFFDDDKIHMVADFYKSKFKPDNKDIIHELCDHDQQEDLNKLREDEYWKLSEVNDSIYVYGQSQIVKLLSKKKNINPKWHIFLDNQEYKIEEIKDYLDIVIDDINSTFTITAINKDLVNYIIKIAISDEDKENYEDFVEMEVRV